MEGGGGASTDHFAFCFDYNYPPPTSYTHIVILAKRLSRKEETYPVGIVVRLRRSFAEVELVGELGQTFVL